MKHLQLFEQFINEDSCESAITEAKTKADN